MRITSFIRKTFFNSCSVHEQKKIYQNYYCIDCDSVTCGLCVSTDPHNQHNFVQVYRYSYRDSVRIDDMKQYIDCSQIQAYKCNGQKVNVLNPLPHFGSKTDKDDCCHICQRKLIDAKHYSYCSIACKLQASSRESNQQDLPPCMPEAPICNKTKQLRSSSNQRKGTPYRAPRN